MKATKLLVALGAAMLFAACSDISSGGSSGESATTDTKLAYIKIVDGSRTLRTAIPTYSLDEFTKFELYTLPVIRLGDTIESAIKTGTSNGTLSQDNPWGNPLNSDTTYKGITSLIGIPEGTYWFKLVATMENSYTHMGEQAKHTFIRLTQAEITEGIENELSFDLYPMAYESADGVQGTGEFCITLALPDTGTVKSVFASLYKCVSSDFDFPVDGKTAVTSYDGIPLSISNNTAEFKSKTYLPSGYYEVEFELYSKENPTTDDIPIETWPEYIIIVNGKCSNLYSQNPRVEC